MSKCCSSDRSLSWEQKLESEGMPRGWLRSCRIFSPAEFRRESQVHPKPLHFPASALLPICCTQTGDYGYFQLNPYLSSIGRHTDQFRPKSHQSGQNVVICVFRHLSWLLLLKCTLYCVACTQYYETMHFNFDAESINIGFDLIKECLFYVM